METKAARMQKFEENTVIVREGEFKNEMYKIVSGKVAVYLNYGKENEYLLGLLSEQQCFGELEILCKKPSIYTVVALYDALLMRIREDEFDEFIANNSKNASDIIRNLAYEVMKMKLNLDMVLDEMANSGQKPCNVHELRQRIYQNVASRENGAVFEEKI